MNYTKPTRSDGAWQVDQESTEMDDGSVDYGPVEVYNRRKKDNSIRPICTIEGPDLEEEGDCSGNISLIAWSPELYETLKEIHEKGIEHACLKPTSNGDDCLACRARTVIDNIHKNAKIMVEEANVV